MTSSDVGLLQVGTMSDHNPINELVWWLARKRLLAGLLRRPTYQRRHLVRAQAVALGCGETISDAQVAWLCSTRVLLGLLRRSYKSGAAALSGRLSQAGPARPAAVAPEDPLRALADRVCHASLFDEAFYREQATLRDPTMDAALHYASEGEARGLLPSAAFDPAYYRDRNPDVAAAGTNLLLHYAEFGRAEGRFGRPPATFHSNSARFDQSRQNIILVVHDTSRSGAPILGWNIALRLAQTYNLFTVRLGSGALTSEFEELSVETHGPFPMTQRDPVDIEHGLRPLLASRRFRYAIVNGAESRFVLSTLAARGIPSVFLLHEFASYVYPAETLRRAFDQASEIVFSAPLVARSAQTVHPALRERVTRILPQGMSAIPSAGRNATLQPGTLDKLLQARATGAFLVVGAGSVEYRKGVDLFLATAAAIRRAVPDQRLHFAWAGKGYCPDDDMGYSVFIREQLQRSGVDSCVTFLGELAELESLYAITDLLYLSSRLDPLPNVSIDAARLGIPIICFQDASGIADLLMADPKLAACVVPYADTDAAGRQILHLASNPEAWQQTSAALKEYARGMFDMERYVAELDRLGSQHAGAVAEAAIT